MPKIDIVMKAKDDASKQMEGLKGKMQGMAQQAKKVGMAFTVAGGAIVGSMALSIKSFAKTGDEIQKMALKTGFSTIALSEFKHAAELGGASLETIEKAVKKMSKSLVDASDGTLTYVEAFQRIGLSAEELINLSPEQQFEKIAFAIAGMENPTIRAAAAQEIFGRAGMDLLPMLADGKEGLALLRQEAHDLGIVFDQEAANKAAVFNDALTKLKGGVEGAKMGIAETLIPVLMPLIEKLVEVTKQVKAWMEAHPELARMITLVVGALGAFMLILGPLLIMLPGLIGLLPILGLAFHAALGPIGLITLAITALIAIGLLMWKEWDRITKDFVKLWGTITTIFQGIANSIWLPVKAAIQNIITYIQWLIAWIERLWAMIPRGGGGGRQGRERGQEEGSGPGYRGGPLAGYQRGGVLPATGLYFGHKGETILPANAVITVPIYLDGELIAEHVIRNVGGRLGLQGVRP